MSRKLGFLFTLCFIPMFLFSQEKPQEDAGEKYFLKVRNFFSFLFPDSFVVQVQSDSIEEDIRSIPKIYVKDPQEKPVLLLFFSQKLGIKVELTNVAKGISKQYNQVSAGFKSFYPFIQNETYQEFKKKFVLLPIGKTRLVMREKTDSKDLFYAVEIDKVGKILSIEQITDKKSHGKVTFLYKQEAGQYIISTLKVVQKEPKKQNYIFRFVNYDLKPDLKKEDFLG